MTILLIVLAWLLCGFVGAYIGHRWMEHGNDNFDLGTVAYITISGPIALIGVSFGAVIEAINWDVIVFKRK